MTEPTPRAVPHNVQAEAALLGCLLIDPDGMAQVADRVRPEMFFSEKHRGVYAAILALYGRDEAIDNITLADELRKTRQLDAIGAEAGIIALLNAATTSLNLKEYAGIVESTWWKRKLITTARTLTDLAYDETVDTNEAVAAAETALFQAVQSKSTARPLRDLVREHIDQTEKRAENPLEMTGIPTGFYDIDRTLSGLNRSDLIIVAARPSMGKTSLQLGMGTHAAAKAGAKVGIFQLEMSGQQLANRLIAALSQINGQRLRRGDLHEKEWPIYYDAVGRLSEMGIYIDDTPGLTPLQLRTKCRRLYAEHGLDLVMVDFLQLMRGDNNHRGNEVAELSEISRGLKLLARELDIPVVVASQLNRDVEKRQDKRPVLSDLRGSGSLEQDADIVMFIYRDEFYNPETTERPSIAEINIAKHRNGPTGTVDLYWHGRLAAFRNLTRREFEMEAPVSNDNGSSAWAERFG